MSDPRVSKLAEILVHYSIGVRPGDWVLINANSAAVPLAEEVLRETLRAGGNPTTLLNHSAFSETLYKEANDAQLGWISPFERVQTEKLDCSIFIDGTENTRALSGIDPARQRIFRQARRDLFKESMRRSAEGSFRWVLTQYPCQALAQEAYMSLGEFEDFVYAATFADQPDPVARWKELSQNQQHLVDWLKGRRQVAVRGPNAELTLSIEGRTFINSDGKRNMPSGEIFTGPVESSANGWIRFTYPAITNGREVEGVELHFEGGRVSDARAQKNQDFLLSMLDSDAGARYLGEFAIGTNYGITRFTKSILFDEKIGGSIHLAVGAGYPETGSTNESSIHWDFICDMRDDSEILVDGELFYKNGTFIVK